MANRLSEIFQELLFGSMRDEFLRKPTHPAMLLAPGIRKRLFRFGSMREVIVQPEGDDISVTYILITEERKTIRVPIILFIEDKYIEMLDLIEHDLR